MSFLIFTKLILKTSIRYTTTRYVVFHKQCIPKKNMKMSKNPYLLFFNTLRMSNSNRTYMLYNRRGVYKWYRMVNHGGGMGKGGRVEDRGSMYNRSVEDGGCEVGVNLVWLMSDDAL